MCFKPLNTSGGSETSDAAAGADLAKLADAQAEAAEQLAAKDALMQQLLHVKQERAELQHAVHALQQDLTVSQQAQAGLTGQVDSLQLQVTHFFQHPLHTSCFARPALCLLLCTHRPSHGLLWHERV